MKDIPGFEGRYAVTEDGRVWSYPKKGGSIDGMWLKSGMFTGYPTYYLRKDSVTQCLLAHRLVAMTYLMNPKSFPQVNHKNGIKTDNRVENLEWCTAKENMQHAFKNKLIPIIGGEQNKHSKLTWNEVRKIRGLHFGGVSQCKLAKLYKVTQPTIWNIVKNITWKENFTTSCKGSLEAQVQPQTF